MNCGDLLFYASHGSFFDKCICFITNSKYVHVAIAVDKENKIEMLGQGCCLSPIIEKNVAAVWQYPEKSIDEKCMKQALMWLYEQIGRPYGWNDAIEALDLSHRFLWLQTNHYDCSHLASEFLKRSGYDMGGLDDDLSRITPAILASFLDI